MTQTEAHPPVKIDPDAIFGNHDQSFKTEAGEFLVEQRNMGYAENDGKWIVNQLSDLYWDRWGYLTKRRQGIFLGIFDTMEQAEEAIRNAKLLPELERHEILSGR